MRTIRLDPDTADRLLAGAVAPDDAPPGYAGVAQLLHTARRGTEPESGRPEATVAAMQAAVLVSPSASRVPPDTKGRKRMVSKALAAKTAAAATVVLLGAGSAAAVSGALSGGAPHTGSHGGVHGAPGHPGSSSTGSTTNTSKSGDPSGASSILTPGVSKRQGNGPSANALPGLCRAKIASAGHPNAHSVVAMVNCAGVTPAGGGSTAAPAHPAGTPSSTTSGTPAGGPPAGSPPGHGAGGGSGGGGGGSSGSAPGAGHH